MAASLVMRLQTIVAREVAPSDQVVVTVGSLHAGTKENIIPDQASIKLNIRSFSPSVRQRVLDAVRRMAAAEATASGAPRAPEFRPLNSFPILANDPEATGKTVGALTRHFGEDRVGEIGLVNASEDFGEFAAAAGAPSVFWYFGGLDPEYLRKAAEEDRLGEVPSNHSPLFAPIVEPTLSTGVHALVAGALSWLRAR
jgi:hippurate hydrolase